MSALATEPLEFAAPGEGPTRARRERLQLVSPPRLRLTGGSLPGDLLDSWNSALAATERALDAAALMKVYAPDELRRRRHRLGEERRWLLHHGRMTE